RYMRILPPPGVFGFYRFPILCTADSWTFVRRHFLHIDAVKRLFIKCLALTRAEYNHQSGTLQLVDEIVLQDREFEMELPCRPSPVAMTRSCAVQVYHNIAFLRLPE
ncbi:MAG: hypothetical protein WCH86_09250, partial [Kiritimatiellales bacterium]